MLGTLCGSHVLHNNCLLVSMCYSNVYVHIYGYLMLSYFIKVVMVEYTQKQICIQLILYILGFCVMSHKF